MEKIINKTAHPVIVLDRKDNVIKEFKPTALSVRLESHIYHLKHRIDGIPITKSVYGHPIDLPEQQDGIYYIVSQLVKNKLPNRTDLLVPAEIVRNDKGHIVGCRSLGV